MAKTAKFNYKVTLEIPREMKMGKHGGKEITVDRMTQYFYGKKNKESALKTFGSVKNLRTLRTQGFAITRSEFKKFRNHFLIERV
jgi:hypothetical protein